MSVGANDLIVVADLKTFLGIASTDTTQDTLLQQLITQCSARIETFCGRTFLGAIYTEYLSGNGKLLLPVRNRPITIDSHLAVYEDMTGYFGQGPSAFASTTLLTLGTDYVPYVDMPDGTSKSGLLLRISGGWYLPSTRYAGLINGLKEGGIGNYKVVYTGGYTAIPQDLQQATMVLCATTRSLARSGFPLISTPAVLVEKALAALPREVLGTLMSYRNLAVG